MQVGRRGDELEKMTHHVFGGKLLSQEPSMEIFQHKNNTYIHMYNIILILNKKRERIQQILSPEFLPLKYRVFQKDLNDLNLAYFTY